MTKKVTISSPKWLKLHPDKPKYVIKVNGKETTLAKTKAEAKRKAAKYRK